MRRKVLDVLSGCWVESDVEMLFSVEQSIQLLRKAWIGRGGPNFWPPRSPDLIQMDFFLWGYVKNIVGISGTYWMGSQQQSKRKLQI
jgi:hypothetical protein